MLTFIQDEKVTKDVVFVILGFLNPVEILRLNNTSRVFNKFFKEYNNSRVSINDAQNQYTAAKREFKEQKDLLPKKLNRIGKVMNFLFRYPLGRIEIFGVMNLYIASSFKPLDQTEVFMRSGYQQFSCLDNRVGNALETITCAEMIFGLAVVAGTVAMGCANSYRERQKAKLSAGKVSQTAFYFTKRKKTQSQLPSRPNFYP